MKREVKDVLKEITSKLKEIDELIEEIKPEVIIKNVSEVGTGKHVHIPKKWDDKEVGIIRFSKKN